MTPHLRRSRVLKAIVDGGRASSFDEAEARLDAVNLCVGLRADQAATPAGQAAALTAIVTARKCFGRVTLVLEGDDAAAQAPLRGGENLVAAARRLGSVIAEETPADATHLFQIGAGEPYGPIWTTHAWWNRWLSGTRCEPPGALTDSRLGLAGVFSGALAVRQVFATVLHGFGRLAEDATLSLWAPGSDDMDAGPARFTAPNHLWVVGLGHLGQAYLWNLLWLPYRGVRRAILQDNQDVAIENEATSVLVLPGDHGRRKVRVAADWLEPAGWTTDLIERRHRGDIALAPDDPPLLLCGLDAVPPRRKLAGVGFDYMVDGGIGSGAHDFEGLQIRVIPKGANVAGLWDGNAAAKRLDRLLASAAYQEAERTHGECGAYALADASVATPFVGAAAATLAVAQIVRLCSMQPGTALLQLSLAAPEMIIDGGFSAPPSAFLGGEEIDLAAVGP